MNQNPKTYCATKVSDAALDAILKKLVDLAERYNKETKYNSVYRASDFEHEISGMVNTLKIFGIECNVEENDKYMRSVHIRYGKYNAICEIKGGK